MGTKLQYAINPLVGGSISDDSLFPANQLDDWDYSRKQGTVFIKFNGLMDAESIKNTMLMQEDVFKQQVRELHRLYSVQKMLMDEMRNQIKQSSYHLPMVTGSDGGYSTLKAGKTGHENLVRIMAAEQGERSGSTSGDANKMPKGFDLERPAEESENASEEAQAGPSSQFFAKKQKPGFDGYQEEGEVELTLSIGGSAGGKKATISHQDCSPNSTRSKSDRSVQECSSSNSSRMSQEPPKKQPHWLFQGLSLNRT